MAMTFRSVVGLGLPFRLYTTSGRFCRVCGTKQFQQANGRTVLLGWWSVFGFFVNLVVIVLNARMLRRVRALGAPRKSARVAPQTVRPFRHPELR